jgi:K+-sensing histidine kinase KdpD
MAKAVAQSEAARNELDAAQRRYLLQSWQYYLRNRPSTDFEVGQANGGSLRPALQRSVVERRTKVDGPEQSPEGEASTSRAVAVPIVLRGQVLGALGFQTEGAERAWTPDEQAMVEAIAERLGMALENLRLLEETQNRVARETLIRQVTEHMRETLDMDTVLRTAADDVFKILDLDEVVIRLSQDGGNGSQASG